MELFELGAEYLKRAELLIEKIHKLNKLTDSLRDNEKILMKRRILSLYCDALECRKCAKLLISYKRRQQNVKKRRN